MPIYMVHPSHGTHIAYDIGEVERCKENGWTVREDAPKNCAQEQETSEIDGLRKELMARGIKYDKRWGVKRLRELL